MINTITYWIRINCKWSKVTTSIAKWKSLPHVVGSFGCKVTPFIIIGLFPPTPHFSVPPVTPVPAKVAPPPTTVSYPPNDVCCYFGGYPPSYLQEETPTFKVSPIFVDMSTIDIVGPTTHDDIIFHTTTHTTIPTVTTDVPEPSFTFALGIVLLVVSKTHSKLNAMFSYAKSHFIDNVSKTYTVEVLKHYECARFSFSRRSEKA